MAAKTSGTTASPPASGSEAFIVLLICALGLALAFWIANYVYFVDLISDPSQTLFLIWVPFHF